MNKNQIKFMLGTAENTEAMLIEFSTGGMGGKTVNEVLAITRNAIEQLGNMLDEIERR